MDIIQFFIICVIFVLFVLYVGFFFSNKFVTDNEKVLYYWLLFISILFPILFYLVMYFYITLRENEGEAGPKGVDCHKQ